MESVDLDRQTAKILYIDFGNEEEVTFDKICSLAENIDLAPACVCLFSLSALHGRVV